MLDCKEQQQAAKATLQAVRGEEVGTKVDWKSESRPNVSGASIVKAKATLADGSLCLTVTDIVIIDGEETTVAKKMCRRKGRVLSCGSSDLGRTGFEASERLC